MTMTGPKSPRRKLIFLAAALALVAGAGWSFLRPTTVGGTMTLAATEFLATLSPDKLARAKLAYDTPKRVGWHFIPLAERKGLQVKDMTEAQRKSAHALLASALSQSGYTKATRIMRLEALLRELEKTRKDGPIRDPERYYFTVFGTPTNADRWGLSVEGHHLSLNFVVDHGRIASSTPSFFGANPAEVKRSFEGVESGTRVLRDEEELAFDLLQSLTAEQRKTAVIAAKAPLEIRNAGKPQPPTDAPEGLAAREMTPEQTTALRKLIEVYAKNLPAEAADSRLAAMDTAGIGKVYFAWSGADKPGIGHYYRIQGPTLLIEFINVQPDAEGNPANHIHSVWRDPAGDFDLPIDGK
jgi:hypothetical protein